ncbi:MAG: TatD family hydrolase [Firmicutes bacterium]|nr:TatD family hydrolase [Candidatus Fermentithermobacillaceae bacterium]
MKDVSSGSSSGELVSPIALIDSHAHVSMRDFDRDREEVIARAKAAGVVFFIEVGFNLESSKLGVELAREKGVFAAVGVHPHDAAKDLDKWEDIEGLARLPEVVAIGEIGLDYYRDLSPRKVQAECFIRGLDLSRKLGLPVIIHEREAGDQVLDILKAHPPGGPIVFHCFSGDRSSARKRLDLGGYLGFGGPITYPRRDELREVLKYCPSDRMLLETDCPYLPPQSFRGRRNEPSYLIYTLAEASRITGLSREDLAATLTENTISAFRLDFRKPALTWGRNKCYAHGQDP